jgi:hypothetical protein
VTEGVGKVLFDRAARVGERERERERECGGETGKDWESLRERETSS